MPKRKKKKKKKKKKDVKKNLKRKRVINSFFPDEKRPNKRRKKMFPIINENNMQNLVSLMIIDSQKELSSEKKKILQQLIVVYCRMFKNINEKYIKKSVFNSKNLSIIGYVENSCGSELTVVSGLTFGRKALLKRKPSACFFEIFFICVDYYCQFVGVGSKMMNFLKDYAQKKKIAKIITHADNSPHAQRFFIKQKFVKHITLPKNLVKRIEDFKDSTLMECKINRKTKYLEIPCISSKHRKKLRRHKMTEIIQKLISIPISYPFREFIDDKDYEKIIGSNKNVSLGCIRDTVLKGGYDDNVESFHKNVLLTFENCMKATNNDENKYYKLAKRCIDYYLEMIRKPEINLAQYLDYSKSL